MKILRVIAVAGLLIVGAACEEFEPVTPETTTTTLPPETTTTSFNDVPTTTTTSGYQRKPLPRNGWTVEQGVAFSGRLQVITSHLLWSNQPNVVSCTFDWFIDHYTPEEILEFADNELLIELSEEGAGVCGPYVMGPARPPGGRNLE